MKKTVAILGSAFNPPSLGHADVVSQALKAHDEVWLVPSYQHAFGKKMIPYDLRLELLRGFALDIAEDRVKVMAVEHIIKGEGAVYTWDLMNYLQNVNENVELSVVIGPDNKENWDKFYMSSEIKDRWSLFVAEERINIRSTYIRNSMKENKCIQGLVSPSVEQLLNKRHDDFLI